MEPVLLLSLYNGGTGTICFLKLKNQITRITDIPFTESHSNIWDIHDVFQYTCHIVS